MEHPAPSKTWELSLYELHRTPQEAITDNTEIAVSPRSLHSELMCPICLDMLKNTMTTKECLHRFCQECIITALRSGNKECPTCRKKLVSKRSLRPDPNFDALISKIYPSRDEYEAHQERVLAKLKQAMNPAALTQNIEEGLRQQALNRAQRVRKMNADGDSSRPESECNTPAEATPRKQNRTTSDESAGENSMSGDPLFEGSSGAGGGASRPAPEIELVFKPHPQEETTSSGTQTRFIKTTANATIEHLSKYLAMRIALEKQKFSPDAAGVFASPPNDKYDIYIGLTNSMTLLSGSLSLAQVNEKYWHSSKPLELFYLRDQSTEIPNQIATE